MFFKQVLCIMIMMTVSHLPWSKRATVYRVRSVQTERFLGQLGCSRDDWNMFHVDSFKDFFLYLDRHVHEIKNIYIHFYFYFFTSIYISVHMYLHSFTI